MRSERMILEKYKGLHVRPDTLDAYVVDEVGPSYRLLEVGPKDTVVDIGANIGAFCALALEKGARVFGYEPFPENFKIAKKNAAKAELENVAVVGVATTATSVDFYVNVRGKNHGAHSSVPTRGRDVIRVPAMRIDKILKATKPTKLKVDCEGAEYDILLGLELPRSVKRIALELHLQKNAHREAAVQLHAQLVAQGFSVLRDPTPSFSTKAWHAIGVYGR